MAPSVAGSRRPSRVGAPHACHMRSGAIPAFAAGGARGNRYRPRRRSALRRPTSSWVAGIRTQPPTPSRRRKSRPPYKLRRTLLALVIDNRTSFLRQYEFSANRRLDLLAVIGYRSTSPVAEESQPELPRGGLHNAPDGAVSPSCGPLSRRPEPGMPCFTIGIPTYNRAHYLAYTLSCLLQQTFADFEVVISDNASTDDTPNVVKQFCDKRVRYVRQPVCLSVEQNWIACAQLAQADWIVFNQDDDVLCPFFLERCALAITKNPELVMYATECAISTNVSRTRLGGNCGAPLGHRWDQPQPRLIPGLQIAALAWFVNSFFPPAQAMPTRLFLKHCPRGPDAIYLGDHCLTSRVACEGTIAFEAYNGAIIREHSVRNSHCSGH